MTSSEDRASSIDQTPISPSRLNPERRNSLEYHLSHRPDRQELVNSRSPHTSSSDTQSDALGFNRADDHVLLAPREHSPCLDGFSGAFGQSEGGKYSFVNDQPPGNEFTDKRN